MTRRMAVSPVRPTISAFPPGTVIARGSRRRRWREWGAFLGAVARVVLAIGGVALVAAVALASVLRMDTLPMQGDGAITAALTGLTEAVRTMERAFRSILPG